jgi:predicted nuclease with TOPRIM domain
MFGKEIVMKEDETKNPEDLKEPEKEAEKAELSPEIKDAVLAVVNEAMAGLTAKYEELNTKINALSGETSAVAETAKGFDEKIREIRKDFALDKNPAPIIDPTPVKKSLLS